MVGALSKFELTNKEKAFSEGRMFLGVGEILGESESPERLVDVSARMTAITSLLRADSKGVSALDLQASSGLPFEKVESTLQFLYEAEILHKDDYGNSSRNNKVKHYIYEDYKQSLRGFLKIKKMLTGSSPGATGLRESSLLFAQEIVRSPQDLSFLLNPLRYKKRFFPKNWSSQGLCIEDSYLFDPDLYIRRGKEFAATKLNTALAICSQCPVRLPCLKDAIEKGEGFLIRGGVWFRSGRETIPERLSAIIKEVEISSSGEQNF